jgi:hypothetical protein
MGQFYSIVREEKRDERTSFVDEEDSRRRRRGYIELLFSEGIFVDHQKGQLKGIRYCTRFYTLALAAASLARTASRCLMTS